MMKPRHIYIAITEYLFKQTINAIVKLNKIKYIKYISFYITKLKNTQESGQSIYGPRITAQFLNKPVGNRNTERPTERLCSKMQQIHTAGSKQMKVS